MGELCRYMIFETVETINGKRQTKRLKTSVILWAAFLSFPLGFYLLINEVVVGGVLMLTVCPCLFLYPLIRFFFFGGRDSVVAVVTTVVVEEVTKHVIGSVVNNKKK